MRREPATISIRRYGCSRPCTTTVLYSNIGRDCMASLNVPLLLRRSKARGKRNGKSEPRSYPLDNNRLMNQRKGRLMAAGSKRSKPHVLFLPSFYNDPDKPLVGSFFKEQAQAVAKAGLKVGVAYVEPRRLRALRISALKKNHGQITSDEEDGVPTMRL